MDPTELEAAADGLASALASIDAGELLATDAQRAYLVGALDTLRAIIR